MVARGPALVPHTSQQIVGRSVPITQPSRRSPPDWYVPRSGFWRQSALVQKVIGFSVSSGSP